MISKLEARARASENEHLVVRVSNVTYHLQLKDWKFSLPVLQLLSYMSESPETVLIKDRYGLHQDPSTVHIRHMLTQNRLLQT